MKKLLLSSLMLFLFSISLLTFQLSCKKDAMAQNTNYILTPATTSSLGGIIVGSGLSITSAGLLSVNQTTTSQLGVLVYYKMVGANIELWTAKYDGTSQLKLNITLPQNTRYSDDLPPKLSPDGKKIFFSLMSTITMQNGTDLYSANIDGSGVTKIIDKGGNGNYIILGGAY